MVQVILDAGVRTVRQKQRDCKVKVQKSRGGTKVTLGPTDTELSRLPVIPVLYSGFKQVMRQCNLDWRPRRYKTEEQRRAAMRASLTRYRTSFRYVARRLLRNQTNQLTEEQLQALLNSEAKPVHIARRLKISLRDVHTLRTQAQEQRQEGEREA